MPKALMPVGISDLWLAVEAGHVLEILGARPWVRIPGTRSQLPGVLAWRGRAIAVLDLGAALGIGRPLAAGTSRSRTIVLQAKECTLAVPVDAVREVQELDDAEVHAPVQTRSAFSTHEVELFGTAMPVLDLCALLEHACGARKAS